MAERIGQKAATTTTPDWEAVESSPEFRELTRTKRSFIIPATIVFVVYYFAFLVIVGYAPDFAKTQVLGSVNVAYLFALSQFILAWVLMALYVRRANVFDGMAARIVAKIRGGK